ncbi:MAG: hypothetical protein LC734_00105, partial [Acidobacteria bacterium]|nr:hypothetical protein [Acidobacteriota bacterium]
MSVYEELSESQQFAARVIADHARSTAFAIADGILPGNEGRNYVLRKIMRRAIYHGREHLGFKEAFFYKVCDFVIDQMHPAYPELEAQREFIGKMVRLEEERFGGTLAVGLEKTGKRLEEVLPLTFEGAFAQVDLTELAQDFAPLYDTYGVPADLLFVMISGRVDEINEKRPEGSKFPQIEPEQFADGIERAIQELQKQSDIGRTQRKSQISPMYAEILDEVGPNKFHGYDVTQLEGAKVAAILDGETRKDLFTEGEQGSIVLNETPFYAESGGQVGDTGRIVSSAASLTVADTYSPVTGLIIHKVTVEKGAIKIGDEVVASVDAEKRDATRRNHT